MYKLGYFAGSEMASAGMQYVDKEVILNRLTCSVCRETFKSPRNLNCGHTFCTNCLRTLKTPVLEGTGFEIRYPYCREITKNVGRVLILPQAFVVSDMIEGLNQKDGLPAEQKLKRILVCVACGQMATDRCCDCLLNMCAYDIGAHKRARHAVAAITETLFCDKHTENIICTFCHDCDAPICSRCVVEESHKDHKTMPLTRMRKQLEDKQKGIARELNSSGHREAVEQLMIQLEELDQQEQTLNNWTKDIIDSLQNLQDKVHAASENCGQKLLAEKESLKQLLEEQHQRVELVSTEADQLLSKANDPTNVLKAKEILEGVNPPELPTVIDNIKVNWEKKDHILDSCKRWKQVGIPTVENTDNLIRQCVDGWQYFWLVVFSVFVVSYLISFATGVEIISVCLYYLSKVPGLLLDALLEILLISARWLLELCQSCIESVVGRAVSGVTSIACSIYNVIVYFLTTCRDGIFVATEYILSAATSLAYFIIYCLTTCKDYILLLAQSIISVFTSLASFVIYFLVTIKDLFIQAFHSIIFTIAWLNQSIWFYTLLTISKTYEFIIYIALSVFASLAWAYNLILVFFSYVWVKFCGLLILLAHSVCFVRTWVAGVLLTIVIIRTYIYHYEYSNYIREINQRGTFRFNMNTLKYDNDTIDQWIKPAYLELIVFIFSASVIISTLHSLPAAVPVPGTECEYICTVDNVFTSTCTCFV